MKRLTASHCNRPFRTIPRLALNLPPLSKGGGLTARHKLSLCCFLLMIPHHFYTANLSAVKTEGLPHQPSPKPTFQKPRPRPALTLTIPANNSTQIHRYITKRLSVKKRATGTFFEDNKAIQNKFRETFYLAKSFPDPSKIRFILRNFAFCGKRFKAPP